MKLTLTSLSSADQAAEAQAGVPDQLAQKPVSPNT